MNDVLAAAADPEVWLAMMLVHWGLMTLGVLGVGVRFLRRGGAGAGRAVLAGATWLGGALVVLGGLAGLTAGGVIDGPRDLPLREEGVGVTLELIWAAGAGLAALAAGRAFAAAAALREGARG